LYGWIFIMNRFGSYRLRMVWASVCLILAGLAFAGVHNVGLAGGRFLIFGTEIPLGFDSSESCITKTLAMVIYKMVPAIILFGSFIQLGDCITIGGVFERYRALCVGFAFAILHGLFLSQLAVMPIIAVSYRLLGNPLVPFLVASDMNAIILGFQLLVWATALGLIMKSNRGLTIFFVYLLIEIGKTMIWGSEFLGCMGVHKLIISTVDIIGRLLPISQSLFDLGSCMTLYMSFGLPLMIIIAMLLISGNASKKNRT